MTSHEEHDYGIPNHDPPVQPATAAGVFVVTTICHALVSVIVAALIRSQSEDRFGDPTIEWGEAIAYGGAATTGSLIIGAAGVVMWRLGQIAKAVTVEAAP